jgi:flavorubredoxin
MKAIVVYESHWGNTEAVARAIAEGIGPGATALTTDEAAGAVLAEADLIVAGAPLMALRLPTEKTVAGIQPSPDEPMPDISHPAMRTWLTAVPHGSGWFAAFETKLHWSPGGATGAIENRLKAAGYREICAPRKFQVTGKTGPLRVGELESARHWGKELGERLREQLFAAAPA